MGHQVITANDTAAGDVVYVRRDGAAFSWVRDIAEATPIAENDVETVLADITAASSDTDVVGIYGFEVALSEGVPEPLGAREKIRAARVPTVPFGEEESARHVR